MDNSSSIKKEWVLTGEAFTKLLSFLDADPERAGEKYETARRLLVKFFDWRGAFLPDELADETLNRVTRKIDEGDAIRDFINYCYGVARLVFLESLKRPDSKRESLEDLEPVLAAPTEPPNDDRQYDCFDSCLETLPAEGREVILQYYQDEKRDKIDHRKALAQRLGIPLNALRSRAQRMRDRLEKCVSQCMEKKSA
ncbi:MAG: sigma-70 family RNA polymerase sigma factor [Acidobacteria bacterium]|nr:sigma-70 family RNA polymerase sigma factor [Acidobacteriota bacterium]